MSITTYTKSYALMIAAGLSLAAAACGTSDGEDPAEAAAALEKSMAPQEVRLVSPELREEQPTLELVGEVRPFETIKISTEVVGTIDEILVEVGDSVRKGDPLVKVDRRTFELRLKQAAANLAAVRAELALAEKEIERKRDLLSDQTIAQAVFDQAVASHDLAVARVAAAEATHGLAERDFDRSLIRAPADGTIARRQGVAGQWADINAPLVELAVGSSIKVGARIPESWAPNLAGLEGFEFSVTGSTGTHYAKLFSVEPVVSQASRSFEVVGTAKVQRGWSVRPGMFATVRLVSPAVMRSLWLPSSAVATAGMPQVFMVEDAKVVIHNVQTGRRDAGMREIVTGLEPEDQVISNVSGLGRGTPVQIVGEADNSSPAMSE